MKKIFRTITETLRRMIVILAIAILAVLVWTGILLAIMFPVGISFFLALILLKALGIA